MGVPGLWDYLKPAAHVRSLTELAVSEGFETNRSGVRGFRLGIDVSLWFVHTEWANKGVGDDYGHNPHLRTLFFRCAKLMATTFLPVFVFDGPRRPHIKRGKRVGGRLDGLVPEFKEVIEAFGFEWHMAAGEAEAELAYLDREGFIDGILTDDVDAFLFGARTVIRNQSNKLSGNANDPALNFEGKDDKNHTYVYQMQDISQRVGLTRAGLILVAVLSGGDYGKGFEGCGTVVAVGLAKCGFGDSLVQAATSLTVRGLEDFLVNWRGLVRQEIQTNSRGFIGRRYPALASKLDRSVPNVKTLRAYLQPAITNQIPDIRWNKEPNLPSIAALCETYFVEWGDREGIIKRFRTLLWPPMVLRILRRAVLEAEERGRQRTAGDFPATPSRRTEIVPCGTPSKMITERFSTLRIATPARARRRDDEDREEERLIIGIRTSRKHVSRDFMVEYHLQISPKQLVRLANIGIRGIHPPKLGRAQSKTGRVVFGDEGTLEDDWDKEHGTRRAKPKVDDPQAILNVWMPACIVDMAEPGIVKRYNETEELKRQKKSKKGKSKQKAAPQTRPPKTPSNAKSKTKANPTPSKTPAESGEEVSDDALSLDEDDVTVFEDYLEPFPLHCSPPPSPPFSALRATASGSGPSSSHRSSKKTTSDPHVPATGVGDFEGSWRFDDVYSAQSQPPVADPSTSNSPPFTQSTTTTSRPAGDAAALRAKRLAFFDHSPSPAHPQSTRAAGSSNEHTDPSKEACTGSKTTAIVARKQTFPKSSPEPYPAGDPFSGDDDWFRMWNASVDLSGPVAGPSSPSKRKARHRRRSTDSDSSIEFVEESLKKKAKARSEDRSPSPSPTRRLARTTTAGNRRGKLDDLPESILAVLPSVSLARKPKQTNRTPREGSPVEFVEVIDLT